MKKLLLSLTFLSLTGAGFAQEIERNSVPSMVTEARKTGNIKLADSLAHDYIENYLLKLKESDLMTKENLLFISENLKRTDSRGFKFFDKHRNEVNTLLGADKAEYALRYAIEKQFIPGVTERGFEKSDWQQIERTVTGKFGLLGQEAFYGRAMYYYLLNKDWKNAGQYFVLYFNTALRRSEFDINEVTWCLFENLDDPEVLKFACNVVMKYALEEFHQNDSFAYDTYANLLYKTGSKEKAIKWEERAVKHSGQDKVFVQTLEKMRKGEKTWKN